MHLEQELAAYKKRLPELLQHEGRYVLIHSDRVIDTFPSYAEALRQGYRDFGLQPFLVKQIMPTERVHLITRLISPVRSGA
jgi:hypothetical protein